MQLHYKTYGETGSFLIIVHGLYGSGDNWATIARQLSAQYRVVVPDLRNHGSSPHVDEQSYPTMVNDLVDLMQQLNIQQAHFVGHSMGGKVVMHFALQHPQMVDQLFVVDIAPKNYYKSSAQGDKNNPHAHILSVMRQLPLAQCQSREQIEALMANDIKDASVCQFLMKNVKRKPDGSFEWKLNTEALWHHLPALLNGFGHNQSHTPAYQKPAVFIRGEHSNYIREDDFFTARKLFPMAEFVTIPNAGHWVHSQQPELLVKTIQYFLDV